MFPQLLYVRLGIILDNVLKLITRLELTTERYEQ